jgi:deoxyadenosine/deoxycytidine kinase
MLKKNSLILLILFTFSLVTTSLFATIDLEQIKSEIALQLARNLKGSSKSKPILILVGGYPGAGKTTLINALAESHDLAVISWNAVRQALLDRHLRGSPFDWEIIEFVNRNLFKVCLDQHLNIVIDANAHASNIELFEKLLKEENQEETYRMVKICLNPPGPILLSRIRAREQRADVHQGTETDLLRDLNSSHKRLHMDEFSLIIKNDESVPFEAELNIVNAFLKPYFDQQQ